MGSLVSGWILVAVFGAVAVAGALLAVLLGRTAVRARRPPQNLPAQGGQAQRRPAGR